MHAIQDAPLAEPLAQPEPIVQHVLRYTLCLVRSVIPALQTAHYVMPLQQLL
jgi:hypothetical protein